MGVVEAGDGNCLGGPGGSGDDDFDDDDDDCDDDDCDDDDGGVFADCPQFLPESLPPYQRRNGSLDANLASRI